MDERLRDEAEKLRGMTSEAAARYLVEIYPVESADHGVALKLIGRRSWKKGDQKLLARHYLSNLPHGNPWAYEVFASFMSLDSFLEAITEHLPTARASGRIELLKYHLTPILQKYASTDSNRRLIDDFLGSLS